MNDEEDIVMTPITVEQGKWQAPVVVTRLALFIYSAAIALCFVMVIVFGVWYLIDRREQTTERAEEARVEAKQQQAEIAQLQEVTADLESLQNPTPEQFSDRIKAGIERCLKDTTCRELFPTLEERTP